METNLLKQAIADAKQLRESAVANAKLALEEAFTPKIKKLIENELFEEDEDNEELQAEAKDADETKDDSDKDANEDEEINIDEILSELSEDDDDADSLKPADKDPKNDKIDLGEAEDEDAKDEDDNDEDNQDDIDLEEIIGMLGETKDEDAEDNKDEDESDKEADLDEAKKKKEVKASDVNENKILRKRLAETNKALATLRTELQEINLLNAKLMYATKIFRTYPLDSKQKDKILEAFDNTNSVNEAKIVFKTITNSFNISGKNKLREHKSFASKPIKTTKREVVEESASVKRMKALANLGTQSLFD